MKLFHLSDLHLGLKLYGASLLEDQAYVLESVLGMCRSERPDGVIIAGDVYDTSSPPLEAVRLFDHFLSELSGMGTQVYAVAGNHDSGVRLSFGARLMDRAGVHIAGVYEPDAGPCAFTDEYGIVRLWLLPFVRPAAVAEGIGAERFGSWTDALRAAIDRWGVDESERNIIVAHQFVTGGRRSESESAQVGGADNVDAGVFAPFDYAALGHLHSPQSVGEQRVRYCGTPLKYSFSEANDTKSVTVVELREKGSLSVRELPLTPLREVADIRGSYSALMDRSFYQGTSLPDDYLRVTLTDEEEVFDAMARLRTVYKNVLTLRYDNARSRAGEDAAPLDEVAGLAPEDMFGSLYRQQLGEDMSDVQRSHVRRLLAEMEEDGK